MCASSGTYSPPVPIRPRGHVLLAQLAHLPVLPVHQVEEGHRLHRIEAWLRHHCRVEQPVAHHPVASADHQHALAGQVDRQVGPRLGEGISASDADPQAAEEAFLLLAVEVRIVVVPAGQRGREGCRGQGGGADTGSGRSWSRRTQPMIQASTAMSDGGNARSFDCRFLVSRRRRSPGNAPNSQHATRCRALVGQPAPVRGLGQGCRATAPPPPNPTRSRVG